MSARHSTLVTFPLYQLGSKAKRQIAVDPNKVTAIRETVHGSIIISYPGKQSFEVVGEHAKVVNKINEARV